VRRLREASTVEADNPSGSGSWGADGSLTSQFAYNGDGVRTSKTVAGDTTQYVLDLAATLPVVISDTEAAYLYEWDIIAQRDAYDDWYCPWAASTARNTKRSRTSMTLELASSAPFSASFTGRSMAGPGHIVTDNLQPASD
jgi:hypothetical protein